jgi:hypothetical protein
MEYGYIVLLAIVVGGIVVFVVLASAALSRLRDRSRGKEAVDGKQSRQTVESEPCVSQCMASKHWVPDKEHVCEMRCRS